MSVLAGMILLVQLHCSPSASGNVDCYDAQKGGAPVLKVEPNIFGGFDLRQSDGKLVRCDAIRLVASQPHHTCLIS